MKQVTLGTVIWSGLKALFWVLLTLYFLIANYCNLKRTNEVLFGIPSNCPSSCQPTTAR